MTRRLKKMGAVDNTEIYDLSIGTIAGVLHIKVCDDTDYVYSVHGRFSDIERAKQVLGSNPFSGKWNRHLALQSYTIPEAVNSIGNSIKYII